MVLSKYLVLLVFLCQEEKSRNLKEEDPRMKMGRKRREPRKDREQFGAGLATTATREVIQSDTVKRD